MKMKLFLPVFLLGFITPDPTDSLAICANMCFDTKPICAANTRGLLMEFHSPCYMMRHNICYGTDYETVNIGPCPRPKPAHEPAQTYHAVSKKEQPKKHH